MMLSVVENSLPAFSHRCHNSWSALCFSGSKSPKPKRGFTAGNDCFPRHLWTIRFGCGTQPLGRRLTAIALLVEKTTKTTANCMSTVLFLNILGFCLWVRKMIALRLSFIAQPWKHRPFLTAEPLRKSSWENTDVDAPGNLRMHQVHQGGFRYIHFFERY